MNATLSTEAPPQIRFPILFGEGVPALAKARLLLAFVNPLNELNVCCSIRDMHPQYM